MQDQKRRPGEEAAGKNKFDRKWEDEEMSKDQQGVDKAPGEERGKGEKVTNKDLKGKQVDADPSTKKGKPLNH